MTKYRLNYSRLKTLQKICAKVVGVVTIRGKIITISTSEPLTDIEKEKLEQLLGADLEEEKESGER